MRLELRAPVVMRAPFHLAHLAAVSLFTACHVGPPVPPNPSGDAQLMKAVMESTGARVTAARKGDERMYGLEPGTLAYEATLASATPKELCFDIKIRAVEGQRPFAKLSVWKVSLAVDGGGPTPSSRVEDREISSSTVGASPLAVGNGPMTVECVEVSSTGNCLRHETAQTQVVGRESKVAQIVEGGGRACFAHGGTVRDDTRRLALHIERPARMEAPESADFRWSR